MSYKRVGAIRFLKLGRFTLSLAIANKGGRAPRKPRDPVARVRSMLREDEARQAAELDKFRGMCLAAIGIGMLCGAILAEMV